LQLLLRFTYQEDIMQTLANVAVLTNTPQIQEESALDVTADLVRRGQIAFGLDELFEDLKIRQEEESEGWASYAADCLNHPLRKLLHQDPFTYRAFSKPRGYAGDAVMMDYIYGMGQATQAAREATPLGRAIFQYMDTRPSALAVRFRRQLIAGLIDEMADRGGTSVLAIAAGHLREAETSKALQSGKVQNFVALDQDESSLAVIDHDYADRGVRTMQGSVRQILSGKIKPGQFDFVYAAGLFDYLNASVAAALTRRMWEMTRPGGLMLIPNFLVGVRDRGYMESFMDWHLIYRDHADMQRLADVLPADEVADYRIFDDNDSAITFLLVTKAR
jgi:extracellular factor (EF) 3-hydroxypalmitic acid methyl ester biosynthesis protein